MIFEDDCVTIKLIDNQLNLWGIRMIELPFGSEFSPSQIDLPELLVICKENEGNRELLEDTIKNRFFLHHGNGSEKNRRTLAMNCRLGMKSYGILDENCRLTGFGRDLYNLRENGEELYKALARHILLNLNGMGFVQCMQDMNAALEKITLQTMRPELKIRGITYPSGGKHPSIMRLWLAKAGVFSEKGYLVNQDRLNEILNGNDDMSKLRKLTEEQRYFLLALLNTGERGFQSAAQITRLASATYGATYPEKSLPKDVLNAIEAAGYIEVRKSTTGRGAKSHLCRPTQNAVKTQMEPLVKQLEAQTDPRLIEMLTKSIPDILRDIDSANTYTKGIALEALAFKLLRILGLDYLATRVRAEATGGNEVDLLFHSDRLVYTRWQIQCKNTGHVSIDSVAREVGLAQVLHSNVIVFITTGTVSPAAKNYANSMMKNSNLSIVFVDKEDIALMKDNPVAIVEVFDREAKRIMQLKKMHTSLF